MSEKKDKSIQNLEVEQEKEVQEQKTEKLDDENLEKVSGGDDDKGKLRGDHIA